MAKPLLSICIPTYNRAHYLKECLECITCQFVDKEVLDQVEVVVSDNASPDNTKELVKNFQRKHDNIGYFRNDTNLGFDRNVDSALSKATGDFRWTLSDDDFIEKESLKFILNIIKKNSEVGCICIDHDKKLSEKRVFLDGNDFLSKKGLMGGLLSQNIFNQKYLPSDRQKYYDNLWFHFSIFLEIIAKRPVLLTGNVLKDTGHSCKWAGDGRAFTTYIYLKRITQNLPNLGYEKRIITNLLNQFAKELPKTVASAKIHGLKLNSSNLNILFKEFHNYPFSLLVSTLIIFTPSFILRLMRNFYVK